MEHIDPTYRLEIMAAMIMSSLDRDCYPDKEKMVTEAIRLAVVMLQEVGMLHVISHADGSFEVS